jgi:hypothetical protein
VPETRFECARTRPRQGRKPRIASLTDQPRLIAHAVDQLRRFVAEKREVGVDKAANESVKSANSHILSPTRI